MRNVGQTWSHVPHLVWILDTVEDTEQLVPPADAHVVMVIDPTFDTGIQHTVVEGRAHGGTVDEGEIQRPIACLRNEAVDQVCQPHGLGIVNR